MSVFFGFYPMLTVEQIKTTIARHKPRPLTHNGQKQAAVAMLLCNTAEGPEVLFIRRAEYEGDPWSVDVAFPGGGIEMEDTGPQQAAEREVAEEIGLKLQAQQYLGQLDDLSGAYLPIQIFCFVYLLEQKPPLQLNGEVVDTFWMPLEEMLNPERRKQANFEYRGSTRTHPIIDLDGYCERFLWGITYRLFENFLSLFDSPPQSTSKKA